MAPELRVGARARSSRRLLGEPAVRGRSSRPHNHNHRDGKTKLVCSILPFSLLLLLTTDVYRGPKSVSIHRRTSDETSVEEVVNCSKRGGRGATIT